MIKNQKNFSYEKTSNLLEETLNISINASLDNFLDLIDEIEKQKLDHFSIALRESFSQYGVSVFFHLKNEISQILLNQFVNEFQKVLNKIPLFQSINHDKFNDLAGIIQTQGIEYLIIIMQKNKNQKNINFDCFYNFKKRKTALVVKKLLTNLTKNDNFEME